MGTKLDDRLKAWDTVLRCLDKVTNATRIAQRCEAKNNAIEAIEKYAAIAKPNPQPGQRTCSKCGGTARRSEYFRYKHEYPRSPLCELLICPEDEHLHVTCCACGYEHWQHCADHVEAPASESGDGE